MTNDDFKEARELLFRMISAVPISWSDDFYDNNVAAFVEARAFLARTEKEPERPENVSEFVYLRAWEGDGSNMAVAWQEGEIDFSRAIVPFYRYRFDGIIQPPIEGGEK